ncbi:hypothetical protein N9U55_03415 [Luminiphilus sp.]|nr:hypothetical protein [Luminiphilus sp.]MDA9722314.1 hypothetical protein [Luminiphilus sp.]
MKIKAEVIRGGSGLGLILVLTLSGCAQDEPTDAERKHCFDRYIREHQAEYPVETLKKTAALKCYS